MQIEPKTTTFEKVEAELREGMSLAKCRKCGCMKETLDALSNSLTVLEKESGGNFLEELSQWQSQMEPIKYACLGCEYCYPAVALNEFNKAYPDAAQSDSLSCAFEVKEQVWPAVPGEYKVLCENGECPVAISTLASLELTDRIAELHPDEVCIVGKTETENIGIDKVIKNTITNRTIKYLVLAGSDPMGHLPGQTMMSLSANGVDEKMRVIGSNGKRPFVRNVTAAETQAFREQVEIVDMIGCEDISAIIKKTEELSMGLQSSKNDVEVPATRASSENENQSAHSCGCAECSDETVVAEITAPNVIEAKEPSKIQMDKAGYFVILPLPEKGIISVEHYSYGDKLLRTIEGKDARSLYWTIVENNWVTQLSHAAYLGKELEKAELSLKIGFKYTQDGA